MSLKVGIHQPNFCPHMGFFYKMSQCDLFIILTQVQFEKHGFQNRYKYSTWKEGEWVTMPTVGDSLEPIYKKVYTTGDSLLDVNMGFIYWAASVLGIDTEIVMDIPTQSFSTQRLIDNINHYGGTTYVTNPSAKDKYLDEELMRAAGIDIEYSSCQNSNKNILEMFEEFGIEGTRKQLYKPKLEKKNASN